MLYKLSWRGHGSKLKTTYEHVVHCFHKLFQTDSHVFMTIDKLK